MGYVIPRVPQPADAPARGTMAAFAMAGPRFFPRTTTTPASPRAPHIAVFDVPQSASGPRRRCMAGCEAPVILVARVHCPHSTYPDVWLT